VLLQFDKVLHHDSIRGVLTIMSPDYLYMKLMVIFCVIILTILSVHIIHGLCQMYSGSIDKRCCDTDYVYRTLL